MYPRFQYSLKIRSLCDYSLVILLQVYRLLVLVVARRARSDPLDHHSDKRKHQRRTSRLFSLIPPSSPQCSDSSSEDSDVADEVKSVKSPLSTVTTTEAVKATHFFKMVEAGYSKISIEPPREDYKKSVVTRRTETFV